MSWQERIRYWTVTLGALAAGLLALTGTPLIHEQLLPDLLGIVRAGNRC
jgi:hypothetical protein